MNMCGGRDAQGAHGAQTQSVEVPRAALMHTGDVEVCDVCGNPAVVWRKCKQLCLQCGTILRSCADS